MSRSRVTFTTPTGDVVQTTPVLRYAGGALMRAWPGCPQDWADEEGRVWVPAEWIGEEREVPLWRRVAQLLKQGLTPSEVQARLGIPGWRYNHARENARNRGLL